LLKRFPVWQVAHAPAATPLAARIASVA
jgi:hypothetical protein